MEWSESLARVDPAAGGLYLVARGLGHHISVADVTAQLALLPDPSSPVALVGAAEALGLHTRRVRVKSPAELGLVSTGALLRLRVNDYLVLERVQGRQVWLIDPQRGRIVLHVDVLFERFGGEAVELARPPPHTTNVVVLLRRTLWDQRRWILALLGAAVAIELTVLAVPVFTAVVVDMAVPRSDRSLLRLLGMGAALLVVTRVFATVGRGYAFAGLRAYVARSLGESVVRHLVSLPYGFFSRNSTGDLLTTVGNIRRLRDAATAGVVSGLLDGVMLVVGLGLLTALSSRMAAVAVVLGLLQATVFVLARRPIYRASVRQVGAQGRARSALVELLTGLEALKAMATEHLLLDRWRAALAVHADAGLRRNRISAAIQASLGTLDVASPLLLLLVGTAGVLSGRMSPGGMLAAVSLAAVMLVPLSRIVGTLVELQAARSHVERLEPVLGAAPEQEPGARLGVRRLAGRITLRDVGFRYTSHGGPVLEGISLDVQPGELVAITGRSGSGKSTLMHLLTGLYPPTCGQVLYDGEDLETLERAGVRRQLGTVPQNPVIIAGSVRENIALGRPELALRHVLDAARVANLHGDVMRMPMGYSTHLVEGGASFSGGERQRLALARALARRPKILLLDEATSALDAGTEQVVQRNLQTLTCTRIVVAHRLSTIRQADRIVVLDGGRIVEQGTHAQLLGRSGIYAELLQGQRA